MTDPELPTKWKATHEVTHSDGGELRPMGYDVMLVASGAAYTRPEWAVRGHTRHYTELRCYGGQWFLRRKPFAGKVRAV